MQIVLIGGGHSHSVVLKKWGMQRDSNFKLTLISPGSITPYSGMIPGLISGFYSQANCHIDLRHLSNFAGAQFIHDRAIGIDPSGKYVSLYSSPPIRYDILSIDIGSIPTIKMNYLNPRIARIKPIDEFIQKLSYFEAHLNSSSRRPSRIVIVGAGAGGIEVSLSLRQRFKELGNNLEITLLESSRYILPNFPDSARKRIINFLGEKRISIVTGEKVMDITSGSFPDPTEYVNCESGKVFEGNFIIFSTKASPHPWLEFTPLKKDREGFIEVATTLESVSHPHIFAAGDTASLVDLKLEKSGVYAVRQGPLLYDNIIRKSVNQPLIQFKPQKSFLSLISTGDGRAFGRKNNFSLGPSKWIWNWKDRIDRNFVNLFQDLPPKKMNSMPVSSTEKNGIRCAGCGSKIPPNVLQRALSRVNSLRSQEVPESEEILDKLSRLLKDQIKLFTTGQVIIGSEDGDDSAVISMPTGKYMVQTIDAFKPIINDLFLAGKITANHCLNDIYAMGANPDSAMALLTLPQKIERDTEEDIVRILSGVLSALEPEGCKLVGGHTNEGPEIMLGLSCTGLVDLGSLLRKSNIQEGDALILTKPLGIGLIFALEMRNLTRAGWIDAAVDSMLLSNRTAMEILKKFAVRAITDVSGFGLAGHLLTLLKSSGLGAEILLSSLPILPGVFDISKKYPYTKSTLYPSNLSTFEFEIYRDNLSPIDDYSLIFDPQTSGGLLGVIPNESVEQCLKSLKEQNYDAACIGRITKKSTYSIKVSK